MAKCQITNYYEEQVLPRIFENVPRIFPEYGFRQKHTVKGRKWSSPLHLDLTPSAHGKREKTIIVEGYNGAMEYGGSTISFVDLYLLNHPNLKPYEAITEIADITGAPKQEMSKEMKAQIDYLHAYYRKLETFAVECMKALQSGSPEVQRVRDYCTSRALSEIEISRGKLGYFRAGCSLQPFMDDALTNMGKPVSVVQGIEYLTIPVISENRVVSIIFRAVTDNPSVRRYLFPSNDSSKAQGLLYNLPVVPRSDSLIMVEGQIDALTIICSNRYVTEGNCPEWDCVALGGSSITADAAKRVARLGYKKIYVLIDRDAQGYNYDFYYSIREHFKEVAPGIEIEMMCFPDEVTNLFDKNSNGED